MSTATEPLARTEVVAILLSLIDRDPKQPRFAENVDTDLKDSFKEHGWFESEPLEVRPHPENPDRYMLVDGERRLASARAAGLKEALCVLTLEVEGEHEGDRLVRQILHNSGKPLTPMEEALAFKRIVDDRRSNGDKRYGVVQLARDLGIPKSTVTDRLAMTEIPGFWMPVIANGPLQTSHVPLLHKWRKVPEKFQLRAFEQMKADYRWPQTRQHGGRHPTKEERIYVGDFRTLVETFMYKFTKPVSEVPGYDGPTEKLERRNNYPRTVVVHAMDPSRWQPIFRKAVAARRAKAGGKQQESYARQNAAQDREQKKREKLNAQWEAAEPAIVTAIAAAVRALPAEACAGKGALAQLLVDQLLDSGRDLDVEDLEKRFIARGATAEALIRFIAVPVIVGDLSYDQGRRQLYQRLKNVGLKVDVASIVAAAKVDDDEQESDDANKGEADG